MMPTIPSSRVFGIIDRRRRARCRNHRDSSIISIMAIPGRARSPRLPQPVNLHRPNLLTCTPTTGSVKTLNTDAATLNRTALNTYTAAAALTLMRAAWLHALLWWLS